MSKPPIKVYFVLGEESGDALGSDLLPALKDRGAKSNREVEFVGLAGTGLSKLGMRSLFNIDDIAVMGFSAVIARLPTIIRRVHRVVDDIVKHQPDVIVLIDSPDFTHAVAKRVRRKVPGTPIINYVCPSVWAWRPGRAKAMRAYVDHVLAILPFEPRALNRLGGPEATYIGHPLARRIAALPKAKATKSDDDPVLLVLPGSRGSELKRMLATYGRTLEILRERGAKFRPVMPAVPHLKQKLVAETADWSVKPTIVDSDKNDEVFATARAALATSGTVTLQLALHKVPMVTGYKMDPVARPIAARLVKVWTALLPNLIADRMVVPEEINELVVPDRLARHLERLLADTHERKAQLEGFDEVIAAMKTSNAPRERAAEVIFDHIDNRL